MASTMDAICSFTISVRRQALGIATRIMGRNQLCTSDGGEIIRRKVVCTSYRRASTVEFSYEDSIASKEIDRIVKSWK